MTSPTALIADDEPLLREVLQGLLARQWQELRVIAQARNGLEAIEQFEPVLNRAKQDHLALERVARWREYVDMVSRARALERRVAEWGSDRVQAHRRSLRNRGVSAGLRPQDEQRLHPANSLRNSLLARPSRSAAS